MCLDPDRIEEKRKRKAERMNNLVNDISNPAGPRMGGATVHIKEGLRSKLKANRKVFPSNDIKEETGASAGVPTYSLSNIGDAAFSTSSVTVNTYNYNDISSSGFNMALSSNHVQTTLPTTNPSFGTSQQTFCPSVQPDPMQFDPQGLDPQILLEYLQDKGIKADGQDILSFESLDMNMIPGENLTGLQTVGAHVQVNSSNVQDTNMDSDNREMFMNAQDALRDLQN
ncbi:hypothetical protein LOTGIDRAFT_154958 [Lottia gigantea]|uniref:Uncharacterized protein n=1 Tax=Lottia gigantea TaxID=225164 RepID=V3ZWZ3_LOTGI|nr:hypothetical protein LOTGIDRAFT_154958 [Lottia gigantea]ESO85466.1 hypothetical protein LOTGIDRAFT_154958 [Lottia gigantea]